MNIGTKSVLFGAHCFFIHPWFVALAWWRLYGFREVADPYLGSVSLRDWRLWLAFFVHDLGYWGKPNMDGPEGEDHPRWGSMVMHSIADRVSCSIQIHYHRHKFEYGKWWLQSGAKVLWRREGTGQSWFVFSFYHSRFLARRDGRPYSMLCVADKLAVALEPWWLYLPRVIATGEINEYMALAAVRNDESKYAGEPPTKYESMGLDLTTRRAWFRNMTEYCWSWALEHRDGKQDTWTPDVKADHYERQTIDAAEAAGK